MTDAADRETRRWSMLALAIAIASCLLTACGGERNAPKSFEVEGSKAERIEKVAGILGKYGPAPGPLVDAHFAEEAFVGDSRVPGPSDVHAFGVITVRPQDLEQWQAVLANSADGGNADSFRPHGSYAWFPSEEQLADCAWFRSAPLIGRSGGWSALSADRSTITFFGFNP